MKNQEKPKEILQNEVNKIEPKNQTSQENIIQTIDDNITKPSIVQKTSQTVAQTSLFQKLPFQFIKFDVKFIEALN